MNDFSQRPHVRSKKNRQEGGEMGEVPAGEGEENRVFPSLVLFFSYCISNQFD
jgi:hypothetical protein